jgi:hypothetical protein
MSISSIYSSINTENQFNFRVPRSSDVAGPEKLLVVYSNGTVLWVPVVFIKQQCQLDVHNFPMDEQHCKVQIGSWTYDTTEVDVKLWEPVEYNKYEIL